MSEEEVDQHGDKTLNAAGVCLSNPLSEMFAVQQRMMRSTIVAQLAFAQGVSTMFWQSVLK